MSAFACIIFLGHMYVCIMVFVFQCLVFRELVGVRAKAAAKVQEDKRLPWFRSIQWAWFLLASFFTWSDGFVSFLREHPFRAQRWFGRRKEILDQWFVFATTWIIDQHLWLSFLLYCLLFMVSVLTLRKGMYKYQLTQYTWTLVTCSIV